MPHGPAFRDVSKPKPSQCCPAATSALCTSACDWLIEGAHNKYILLRTWNGQEWDSGKPITGLV